MGIKRLYQLLRLDFKAAEIGSFANQRLAIDTHQWIYHAYFSQLDYSGDYTLLVIRAIDLRLKLFAKFGITVG